MEQNKQEWREQGWRGGEEIDGLEDRGSRMEEEKRAYQAYRERASVAWVGGVWR